VTRSGLDHFRSAVRLDVERGRLSLRPSVRVPAGQLAASCRAALRWARPWSGSRPPSVWSS